MIVICNHKGGVSLPGLRIAPGRNEIDGAAWEAAMAKVSDRLMAGLMAGSPPMLEVDGDKRPTAPVEIQAEAPPKAAPIPDENSKKRIARVQSASTLGELTALADGETRKTVIAAIERRLEEIG